MQSFVYYVQDTRHSQLLLYLLFLKSNSKWIYETKQLKKKQSVISSWHYSYGVIPTTLVMSSCTLAEL